MEERAAVNRVVAGSIPAPGADRSEALVANWIPNPEDEVRFLADLPSECRRGLHPSYRYNVFDILVALLLRDALGVQPACLAGSRGVRVSYEAPVCLPS